MEQSSNSNSKLFLVAIFLVIVFVLYIGYQKGLIFKPSQNNNNSNNETGEKTVSKSLKADSRLVTFLYNEVTYDANSCVGLWEYTGGVKNQNEFIADGGDERIKMRLVGRLLVESNAKEVEISKIPDRDDGMQKVSPMSDSDYSIYYTLDYVQSIYQQIFGEGAHLNKDIGIEMDPAGGVVYYYDKATSKYYPYYRLTGSECEETKETTKIKKAEIKKDNLIIYQSAIWKEEGKSADKYTYVYKFEKESDGLYKYVSRKVEKE